MSATSSSRRSAPVRCAAHAALLPASWIVSAMLAACSKPPPDAVAPRPVRAQAVVLAAGAQDDNYTGAVRARVETDLAFRVGGKVVQRKVDVGQQVRTGDVLAALDAGDYGLGVAAAVNQEKAAAVEAGQAATDAARFARLQVAGAIGQGEAERQQARADAARERLDQARRQAELARNRATYAVLRAPFDGVVTSVRFETGQVVSEGQTVMTLAAHGEREIVVDIPETRVLQARRATLATASLWVDEANAALPAGAGNAGALRRDTARTLARGRNGDTHLSRTLSGGQRGAADGVGHDRDRVAAVRCRVGRTARGDAACRGAASPRWPHGGVDRRCCTAPRARAGRGGALRPGRGAGHRARRGPTGRDRRRAEAHAGNDGSGRQRRGAALGGGATRMTATPAAAMAATTAATVEITKPRAAP